jgi:hypothetical protein
MLRSDKLEIDAMARALIRQHGAEAEIIAAGHADTMLDVGDVSAFDTWKAVMALIHRLQADQPHHL